MPSERTAALLSSSDATELARPQLLWEMGVNSLNYCAFDLVADMPKSSMALDGYVAVPHTLDAAWIDVYELPTRRRVVEALGRKSSTGSGRPPIVMALQLCRTAHGLAICAGYEDGSLHAWSLDTTSWTATTLFAAKPHAETVLGLCTTGTPPRVLSVGADYVVASTPLEADAAPRGHALRRPGHACVAARGDGQVLAIGGWDAMVRMYALPGLQPLAVLSYHKDSIQALGYERCDDVHVLPDMDDGSSDDSHARASWPWLAAGSKDGRVSLWQLPFTPEDVP